LTNRKTFKLKNEADREQNKILERPAESRGRLAKNCADQRLRQILWYCQLQFGCGCLIWRGMIYYRYINLIICWHSAFTQTPKHTGRQSTAALCITVTYNDSMPANGYPSHY